MNLLTNEQIFRKKKKNSIFLPRSIIIDSNLFWSMPKTAIRVYMIFKGKCVVEKVNAKSGRESGWMIKNNGKIKFSYKEAKEKYGISCGSFAKAIDSLIEKGFIDLDHQGSGTQDDYNLYAISDRWKSYGTEFFVKAARTKRTDNRGKRWSTVD